MTTQPARNTVLVVEDDVLHADLLRTAWNEAGLPGSIVVTSGADDTYEFIDSHLAHAATMALRLVLLDLNLPGRDGREVLRDLRSDPRLDAIPIVIMSTSNSPTDMDLCANFGADGYVVKPHSYRALVAEVAAIAHVWLPDPTAVRASR